MRSRLAVLVAVLLVVVAACSSAGASPSASGAPSAAAPTAAASATAEPSAAPVELTVFGAASLKGALDKAKAAYETANPGTTVTLSTDSSSALETQIEQGAPADVFLSADTTNPKKLVDAGLAEGAAVTFAGNKLTIIVPSDNPAKIATPADLAKAGIKVIAAGDEVPITKYATQLVDNLAKEVGYPADFAAAYSANIASKEDNVKERRRQDRTRRGRCRDRVRDRRQGLDQGRDRRRARLRRTCPRPTPASWSRHRRTPRPRRPSSTGSRDRTARRSWRIRLPSAAVIGEAAGRPGGSPAAVGHSRTQDRRPRPVGRALARRVGDVVRAVPRPPGRHVGRPGGP